MRTNLPVTQRNVDMNEGEYIVSRTDVRGVITYANDAFIAMSGYSREELIGQNHNLIRHPDMPPAGFGDLWATLKSGRCWVGLVKNRRKNGDHYWVRASVAPMLEGGVVTGYISVRVKPTAEMVAGADAAYARVRNGDKSISVSRGQVVRTGLVGIAQRAAISIRVRLAMTLLVLLGFIAGAVYLGLGGMHSSNQGMERIYRDGLLPTNAMSNVSINIRDAWLQLCLASQPSADMADAIKKTEEHVQIVDKNILVLCGASLASQKAKDVDTFAAAVAQITTTVFKPAIQLGQLGKRAELQALVLSSVVHDQFEHIDDMAQDIFKAHGAEAAGLIDEQAQLFKRNNIALGVMGVIGFLIALSMTIALPRLLSQRITSIKQSLDRVSNRDYSERIDLSRHDEFQDVSLAIANLQSAMGYAQMSSRETRANTLSEFDRSVAGVLGTMSSSIKEIHTAAQSQSAVADQVTSNSQVVASSAGELNASIKEISRQASQVSDLAREAAQAAESGRTTVASLTAATAEITAVTQLIANIAAQTNLLALNATIEAARAGEAGRGFAVVASEVKSLANQTHQATGDIAKKIEAVQRDSLASAQVLEAIAASIAKLNDASHSIAAGVEEQSATVDELARNAEQSSTAAGEATITAQAVARASDVLSEGEISLQQAVGKFKAEVSKS